MELKVQGIDPSIGCSCILQWFSVFAAVMNEWGGKKNHSWPQINHLSLLCLLPAKKFPVFCLHLEFLRKGIRLDKCLVRKVDLF